MGAIPFAEAWTGRQEGRYGPVPAYFVDLERLIAIKSEIDDPRHQDDARILRLVQERKKGR